MFTYAFSGVLQAVLEGIKRYTALAKVLTVSKIAMVAFTVVGLLLFHNVNYPIIAWIMYYSILILWSTKIIGVRLFLGHSTHYYSKVLRFSAPLGIAAIISVIGVSGDLIVVGGYTADLGVYNAAVTIASVLGSIIATPLNIALIPEISSSSHDNSQVFNGIRLAFRLLFLILLPASLLIAALSMQLLSLFSGGGPYLNGVGALELISITFLFQGIQISIYSVFLGLGKTTRALAITITMALVDVGGSLFFVPNFGILGAAISRSLMGLTGMVIAIYLARSYLGKLDSPRFYVKSLISGIVPYVIVSGLTFAFSSAAITVVPYSIAGFTFYLISIRAMKVLNEEDKSLLSYIIPSKFHKIIRLF